MTKKLYSVAKGEIPGIFTMWNKCQASIHKFPNSVYKGFRTIDQAVVFLLADGTYNSCKLIPVYDETTSTKFPKYFEHECTINCSVENIEVKQAMILDSKNNEGHEVSTLDSLEQDTVEKKT